ncbi:MAG: tRNA (adenosine(37)-N6)-threonylcarbamoyltransferase complex transferase subunit TsaD, partial [Candidatus Aenigmarchaeota archaeon CG01_land_8_20_14_3_00_37_9]
MKILAIDTSCDETSASVCSKDRVLSNVIFSQVELHSKWRGVVPIIAKRAHQERINPVIEMALKRAKVKLEGINVFAVTAGPGLAIALEVGIKK